MIYKAASIGTFDGVHRGHRSVLELLVKIARERNLNPIAISFTDHPLALIAPERKPSVLTPLDKKEKLLKEAGVTPVIIDFDEKLRATTASEWMKFMHDEMDVRVLVIGYDTTFGSDGVFLSLDDYKNLGENTGIEVIIAPKVPNISSSAIRKAVEAGEMEKAALMLGRPYSITSRVEKGNMIGHDLGFPTANIDIVPGIALPKSGAYAAIVKILSDGSKHPAMVNIGSRPTIRRGDYMVLEAHLIDWTGDLYDKKITVRFIRRIRDEQMFDSIDILRQQLRKDKETALSILNDIKK